MLHTLTARVFSWASWRGREGDGERGRSGCGFGDGGELGGMEDGDG